MKKSFLILLSLIMTSTFAFGQKIVMDKTDANGFRVVSTDNKTCRDMKDKVVFSYGIDAIVDTKRDSTLYELFLKLGCNKGDKVSKGGKVLIKTHKGNVIEATVDADNFARGRVENVNGLVLTLWEMYVHIPLSHTQLQELATDGVQKIRIEGFPDNFEKEYSKDKTSKAIAERLALVDKTLSKKKSFSDGF